MATLDSNDPNNPDQGGGGDWWSQNQPPALGPGNVVYDRVAELYRMALGREGSPAEITQWSQGRTVNDLAQLQQEIYATPEAQTYGSRNANPPKAPDPVNPNPVVNPTNPGTISGNTGAVPQGVPTSGFGAAPAPYASNPNAPQYAPMPTYVPPTWTGGDYVNPTEADLLATPGYQARLDAGLQARNRSAAAQGTVLNGGTLKALDRTAQDYASNEYQTLRNNTYDAYVQKYKQFTDAAGMDLNARTVNANENQNTFANRTSTYNTGNARTLSDYITNVTNNRNAELDYWNRLNDVNSTGASLAGASR